MLRLLVAILIGILTVAHGWTVGGQTHRPAWQRVSNVVIPQARGYSLATSGERGVIAEAVRAHVEIRDRTAATTLEVALRNPLGRDQEAVLVLPVPANASVSSFLFEGSAAEPTAELLPHAEARTYYRDIVARLRDPALLEFAGYNLVRSSVFPVPAGGQQKVRIRYEEILGGDGPRVDYMLPRAEAIPSEAPWTITVDVRSSRPVSTVYSPSHEIDASRKSALGFRVTLRAATQPEPGPFRLSYLEEGQGLSASLMAYPDPASGGGYFLLMAGLPVPTAHKTSPVPREVTLVIDRSGSMAGAKMDQVRAAATQIIDGLEPGEAFNIIDYATGVRSLAPRPVIKSAGTRARALAYLHGLRPIGGTNIHDALVEALRQPVTEGTLPMVLFLTDGLPTVGRRNELVIRKLALNGNAHGRRVFTFGVGNDVNVPLLDHIAESSRAFATYVLPGEDVEESVAGVFRRLSGPVLSDTQLVVDRTRVSIEDVMPPELPDLFEGDQLIAMGRYTGNGPLHFEVSGRYRGQSRVFAFDFDLETATTRNAFVPRLWASRRIAYLGDRIRQHEELVTTAVATTAATATSTDARMRADVDEILRLSTEFGVLSEYTAFLALEGTDLSDWNHNNDACTAELVNRAVRNRSGSWAVSQGKNFVAQKQQVALNPSNGYWDAAMNRVSVSRVKQVCDRSFFQRGQQWVDARLATHEHIEPHEIVEFGSDRFHQLLDELVEENRQGQLALNGEILIRHEGRRILVRNPSEQP